jgi:hypothetical protein
MVLKTQNLIKTLIAAFYISKLFSCSKNKKDAFLPIQQSKGKTIKKLIRKSAIIKVDGDPCCFISISEPLETYRYRFYYASS